MFNVVLGLWLLLDPGWHCPPTDVCSARYYECNALADQIARGRATLGGFTADQWLDTELNIRKHALFWYHCSQVRSSYLSLQERHDYADLARAYLGDTLWYSHDWWPR